MWVRPEPIWLEQVYPSEYLTGLTQLTNTLVSETSLSMMVKKKFNNINTRGEFHQHLFTKANQLLCIQFMMLLMAKSVTKYGIKVQKLKHNTWSKIRAEMLVNQNSIFERITLFWHLCMMRKLVCEFGSGCKLYENLYSSLILLI